MPRLTLHSLPAPRRSTRPARRPSFTALSSADLRARTEPEPLDVRDSLPSLEQLFARSVLLGTFTSRVGRGALATERLDGHLHVYLKTESGFSFADNAEFRAEAARRATPLSERMFDDPRTCVRFILGPSEWTSGAQSKTVEARSSNGTVAFASIPVVELRDLSRGKGLALYAEVCFPDWNGGTGHIFVNPDGQAFSNFAVPDDLLK